jgi:uncharacterized DUF497 family protein
VALHIIARQVADPLAPTTGNPYMNDDEFEWDPAKAAANFAAHGVSFEAARRVFDDPFAIEHLDDREDYGEERFNIIGMVEGRISSLRHNARRQHSNNLGAWCRAL